MNMPAWSFDHPEQPRSGDRFRIHNKGRAAHPHFALGVKWTPEQVQGDGQ